MTDPIRVHDLFDLPQQVHEGDFVLKLTEGLEHPDETAGTYVVTEALADAFDQSLSLVNSALRDGRSKATYLHGSFGSGKSHFMAMLSLLLKGHEAAWRIPALHALRQKFGFVGKKKLCQLSFHMIGAHSLEEKIFSSYVAFVQAEHPDATIPGLFADEKIFEDAQRLLENLGDEKFFAALGGPQKKGWGKLGEAWDRERFDLATASTDPEEREKLFSALAKSWFQASVTEARTYVDLDSGLAVMARHAAELGYDGVVLFLDELILWLSHRASDSAWLHNEVQKMVKLVEAQESDRRIPIVSFIARQRDLAEMVGKLHTGAENARLHDSLNHWEGRYGTITLGDQNLPEIVEKRILRPKDEASKGTLDRAFESLRASAGGAWNTLVGQQDAAAFRKLYPFSPALVDALIALSNSLQRERTAIKLLMEILVEHIPELQIGEVVRVGDLFDVLAGGEDPADGLMRSRFNSAKHLYRYQFLPVIQETNGTNSKERCQRLRPGHPPRLGCSGCPEALCRKDNRLIKTLLIAALVPEVPALKDLTASRLAQLNHGTIKVLIPGTETAQVAQQLKKWASATTIAQLYVGSETDPAVHVRLEGVDIKPILERYSRVDNLGTQQRVVREILFEALGMDKVSEAGRDEKVEWRGTRRHGHVLFGNVRTMSPAMLRCSEDHDFRFVIDYPFDEDGKGPADDLRAIEQFKEADKSWTLVWLPHFFSASLKQLLGELVVLEHIMGDKSIQREAVKDLSLEDQSRALSDLDNLRAQKKARLHEVLEQAYGLRQAVDADIDGSNRVEQHLHVLTPGAEVPIGLAPNLASAKEVLVSGLLDARYPRHPHFTKALSAQRTGRLLEKFGELLTAENKLIPADRELHGEMLGTLGELGIVRLTETSVQLLEDKRLQALENRRQQLGVERPTVGELRHWLDEGHKMGLQIEAQDLVVRCYALWARRTFELHGKPYEPKSPLHADAVLEKPDLPDQAEWTRALGKAAQCFGVTFANRFLSPDNLGRFRAQLGAKVESAATPCADLPPLLARRSTEVGLTGETDRLQTARSADELCTVLRGKTGLELVRTLAGYEPKTSGLAVGRHVGEAQKVTELLRDDVVFGVFEQLRARRNELTGAEELLEHVHAALRQDEINVALVERVRDLARQAQRLLHPDTSRPGATVVFERRLQVKGGEEIRRKLSELVNEAEAKLSADPELEMAATIIITKRP